jgi:hypothetical protein
LARLCAVAVVCVVAPLFIGLLLFVEGSTAGAAMTSLAGNPPVNAADTDMSITFIGALLALSVAAVSYLIVRPAHLMGFMTGGIATPERQ